MTGIESILPKKDERAAIVGMSGGGKSFLATRILGELQKRGAKIVVVDPKRLFAYPNATIVKTPGEFLRALKAKLFPILYRPGPDWLDNLDGYDVVLKAIYEHKNLTLYVDDLVGVLDGNRYPKYLKIIYTMGRQRNIRTIAALQRPAWVPLYTLTESTKIFVFRLTFPPDTKRIAEMTDGYSAEKLRVRYAFWYYDVTSGNPATQMILKDK